MTYQIIQIAPDLVTGRVTVNLTDTAMPGPHHDFVSVVVAFTKNPAETEAAMETRAKEAVRKALQAVLAAL